ncbi:hypothetical protein CR513_36701, partial [Mucuna pruriens]
MAPHKINLCHSLREGNNSTDYIVKLGPNSRMTFQVIHHALKGLQPLPLVDVVEISFLRL